MITLSLLNYTGQFFNNCIVLNLGDIKANVIRSKLITLIEKKIVLN